VKLEMSCSSILSRQEAGIDDIKIDRNMSQRQEVLNCAFDLLMSENASILGHLACFASGTGRNHGASFSSSSPLR
jgi:hypothetical protein